MADGSVTIEVTLTEEQIEEGLKSINSNFKEIKKTGSNAFNDMSNCVKSFSEKTINASKKISDMGKKISILSTGIITAGGLFANSAMNLEDAVAKYVSTTNTATSETEKYKKVLSDINNAGYGEGYEDIANTMGNVKKQLKDIDSESLKNVTEKAIALRDLFGYEVSESIRSVKALMDNFGISADEAFNLIVEGQKQGLDFSNEMLDSINEYSVQFDKLGLTAEDMFNIFKSGADSGAFNLDKIGDAVKEFSIRAIDGSKTTIEGFKKIGLSADDMAKKFAKGGDTAKEAFIEVIKRLSKMDNEVEQSIAGVDLFGTMWEDLGPTVIESFSKMDKGISKNSDSMQKSMDELYGTTKSKIETQLKRLKNIGAKFGEKMLPAIEKLIDFAEEFVEKLNNMTEAEMNNVTTLGLIVAAAGPVVSAVGKITSAIGSVVKVFGTFKTAMDVAKEATTSASTAVNGLAKVFGAITSPIGLAITGITTSISLITIAVQNMTKDTKEAFTNMGNSASKFIAGIDTAESHLDEFNSTLFASSEEQQKLKADMQEVQDGITSICKTASNERRNYTQKEITQLDEYFKKLRELKDREIEIQQSISGAIAQQAEQNAQSFQGSLEEYKINSQEWINTAQQQAETEIALINERTTQEIALLQQRFGSKATLENEEYAREYNKAIEQKDKLIAQANEQVAKVNSTFAEGYLERSKQENGWYNTLKTYTDKQATLQENHNKKIQQIKDGELWYVTNKNQAIQSENDTFSFHQQETWNEMYENMDENQQNQLGVWLAMVAQTEMYGGEIDDETKAMVDSILASYDSMPGETKEAMKNAMEPMLTEMENKEPSLFAKASSIAGGILSRLKKAFDIHSPSKKTRKIFEYVMEGAELGLDKKEKSLYKDIDRIAEGVLKRFKSKDLYSKMQSAVDFETQRLSANLTTQAVLKADKNNVRTVTNDNGTVINNTQNFYEKNPTPYEEQKQAKQQLRRLAYGL